MRVMARSPAKLRLVTNTDTRSTNRYKLSSCVYVIGFWNRSPRLGSDGDYVLALTFSSRMSHHCKYAKW